MSDTEEVQIANSFNLGFWTGFGALCALGWMVLIGKGIDWLDNKLSPHKAHYIISVHPREKDTYGESYFTEDYSRKLSGQIVFSECYTANQITLSPSNYKIEIATINDKSAAQTCKVE